MLLSAQDRQNNSSIPSSISSNINSIGPSSSNSREDCLHCRSGCFSQHHQPTSMAIGGEATTSHRCSKASKAREVDKADRARGVKDMVSRGKPV